MCIVIYSNVNSIENLIVVKNKYKRNEHKTMYEEQEP